MGPDYRSSEEEEEEEEEGFSMLHSGGDFSDEDLSGSSRTAFNAMSFFLIDAKAQLH